MGAGWRARGSGVKQAEAMVKMLSLRIQFLFQMFVENRFSVMPRHPPVKQQHHEDGKPRFVSQKPFFPASMSACLFVCVVGGRAGGWVSSALVTAF